MDESANPQAHFLIPANCILPAFFYTQKMETSIQAYGLIVMKDKEKLTTRTERSMRDNGNIIVVSRDMELELYTLQTDKYSTKASG